MRRKILPEFSDRKFFPPLARRALNSHAGFDRTFKGSLAKGGKSRRRREDFSVHSRIFRTHVPGSPRMAIPTDFAPTFAHASVGSIHESTAGYAHICGSMMASTPTFSPIALVLRRGGCPHPPVVLFLRFPCMRLVRRKILPVFIA